jgi:osmotically-inducible protein OsmY
MKKNIFRFAAIFLLLNALPSSTFGDVSDVTKAKFVPQDKIRKDLSNTKSVKSAIYGDPRFSKYALNIDIKVEDGVVFLTGFVPTLELKQEIEQKTQSVPGINSVLNHLEIKDY